MESPQSLAGVANDVGFYDQSHFARVFKRTTGMTPGEYRRSRTSPDPHRPLELVHTLEHLATQVEGQPRMRGGVLPHHVQRGVRRLAPEKRGQPSLEVEDPAAIRRTRS
jgi:hypothetical protein